MKGRTEAGILSQQTNTNTTKRISAEQRRAFMVNKQIQIHQKNIHRTEAGIHSQQTNTNTTKGRRRKAIVNKQIHIQGAF